MLKTSVIPALFDCLRHLLEKSPEIVHPSVETAAATGVAAILAPAAIPLAIAGPTIVEQYARHRENRPDPAALAELFRKALRKAVKDISEATKDDGARQLSGGDRVLLELWSEGLSVSSKDDPYWARMLEEDIPDEVTRLIGISIADAPSNWPALRAVLERWTDWFHYRRTTTATSIVAAPPRHPLLLSAYGERFLAVNLTAALIEEFRKELTGGHEVKAFRQALLESLAKLDRELAPLDLLRPIGELPCVTDIDTEVQLLNARYRAIPYIGREDDLNALFAWLNDGRAVSFQVVTGRGGSGKTRLAYRLLELLEEREPYRWHAGMLDLRESPAALARERFQRWRGWRPTLIVIDYAAAHTEELKEGVAQLYSSTMRARSDDAPLRFLLLERNADEKQGWYKSLIDETRDREKALFPNPPLPVAELDESQRVALLDAGLEAACSFDRRAGGDRPRVVLPEGQAIAARIRKRKMEDPLVLLMAALVAHTRQDLSPLNLDRMELAKIVAGRERLRLQSLVGKGRSPFLPLHLAAYVTVTGSLTYAELESVCGEEKASFRETSWQDHELLDLLSTRALPPTESVFAVDPIVPDVVGESFVLDVWRDPAHHPEATLLRMAERKAGTAIRTLVRMVQDFAPVDGATETKSLDQEWVLALLTHLLASKAAALRDADFWEIHRALPVDTIAMRRPARDFYRSVSDARAEAGEHDAVWLASMEWFAVYAGAMGQRGEALRSIAEVVEIRRKLAAANPDAFQPALANSLTNQANMQSAMGQRGEALRSIAEAVEIYRKLAAANPDAFQSELALSLNNQSAMQSEMGQRGEALCSIGEAVEIRRHLAAANPDAFQPALASSLNNQSKMQSEMGQRGEALRSIGEAAEIYRHLAAAGPDAFQPALATSLNNQSTMQSEMGQRGEALRSIGEAVEIRRHLAAANPDAFQPALAMSLNNQAARQSEMGQRGEALRSIAEAVPIYRKVAAGNPDAFRPDLAMSLNNRSAMQSAMGQHGDALHSIGEGVEIYRLLAAGNQEAFEPALAMSLNNQANMQSAMGQHGEALRSIGEAVEIRRKLAAGNPDAFLPDLAMSHGVWGQILMESQPMEAAEKFGEGIRIISPDAFKLPEAHLPVAMNLARYFLKACELAEVEPDAELLHQIEELVRLQEQGH